MAALNSERLAREGMEARIMARLNGFPAHGAELDDPSAAQSQDSDFVWYHVHTWSTLMESPASRESLMSILQRELEISSHSPPHVRNSLDLVRGWMNSAITFQLDYTHPDSPFVKLGASIIRVLRENHLSRSGVNMQAYHRIVQTDDDDPFTAAAAKAGQRAEKKKTVKCFNCGQPGHMSNACTLPPKDKNLPEGSAATA